MSSSPLKAEFEFYVAHQAELAAKYRGRVLVIKDQCVVGDYESDLDAVRAASKNFAPGTFLVQRAEPGNQNITQSFHSRVTFA